MKDETALLSITGGFTLTILMAAVIGWAVSAAALDDKTVVGLRRAGLSDATIAAIVRTKAIETGRITLDQVQRMRAAGIGDDTIRLLIQDGAAARNPDRIYGQTTRSIETVGTHDLIGLKEAGFSDAVVQAVILYRSADTSPTDRHKAWQMLTGMGLILDHR